MNGTTLAGKLSLALAALALASSAAIAQGGGSKPVDPMAQATQRAPGGEKLDINTASVAQLEALKGIGPVRAAAIVKGRPYKGKDDLVRRKILPQSVYDEISDEIIAKQK
jgi:DNA uptake protein ComE-like DNA-binding protein